MVFLAHYPKVFETIIMLVPVDMMYNFVFSMTQAVENHMPSEVPLHCEYMGEHPTFGITPRMPRSLLFFIVTHAGILS